MNLGLVAVVFVGLSSGIVSVGHGAHPSGQCYSPLGVPCAPKRDSYGYFPTTWRRWPTQQPEAIVPRAPETLPTPAEQPSPTIEPEAPGTVPSGPAPSTPSPTVPGDQAPLPPFDAGEQKPPFEGGLLPSPFDDAPPGLPDAGDSPAQPPMNPQPPADALPSNVPPGPPEKQPAVDADLPPTMPPDDPFKDDPETGKPAAPGATPRSDTVPMGEAAPMPEAAPKTSAQAPAELSEVLQQAAAARDIFDGPQLDIESFLAAPGRSEAAEPRRLEMDAAPPADALPTSNPRANPLRSASQTSRRQTTVSATSFTSASAVAPAGASAAWRRNPLRSH